MAPQSHRRQVILFLAAVLFPCAALLGLGLRLVIQERELASARLVEERRRVIREIRQDLSARLERTALRQVTALATQPGLLEARSYDDSAVVLVAQVSGGQLVLPWEHDEGALESRALLSRGQFGSLIQDGERAEFAEGSPARALEPYRRALDAARQPLQEAQARLSLARAVAKAGRQSVALAEYRQLVRAPPEVVDGNGVPVALYAARQLLIYDEDPPGVSDVLRSILSSRRWLSPPALYLLRDLANTLAQGTPHPEGQEEARALAESVAGELTRTEQALALKRDFPRLGIRFPDTTTAYQENTWIPYGEPAWLVGAASVGGGNNGILLAVLSEPLFTTAEGEPGPSEGRVGEISLTTVRDQEGEPLGSGFPGLFVRFRQVVSGHRIAAGSIQWWFYTAGLLLIFGVTLFGAYLLWRDVRREVQMAETRSQFVAGVSHELKTPLTAIRMFAETLLEGGAPDSETRGEYLETIVNESERLTRLLNNVLDFSKIEGGRKTYRQEVGSLQEIVRFTARAMRFPLEQKRFRLHVHIDDNVPPARVDRDAIEQAILNLMANAMKYSGESRDIDLRLRSGSGEAVIEVRDQGVGIDPPEVPRIFDRFYRVSGLENDHLPGAGLGLTLVQHIAHAHGGRVAVRSELGHGSTFSLFIPLEGAKA
jgi:signal transduction histidine kinase